MDFAQVKNQIETGVSMESTSEDSSAVIPEDQPRHDQPDRLPVLQPIFDAHDLVADLYDQIPKENRWKRLAMKKALKDRRVITAEDAVSEQCRIVLDGRQSETARKLAGERIAEGMRYWQQLILGRS